MKLGSVLIVLLMAAGCSTSKPTADPEPRDTPVTVEPRLIFGFTSSGYGNRPSDAMRLDSTGQMTYTTRSRISAEDFSSLTGMAFLEDQDYAQLLSIVRRGNLTAVDEGDVGIKCPQGQGEMMSLVMRMTDQPGTINLTFDECALEYNLLLESQRAAFKELVNWFNFVRSKYRPYKP